jgi:hypothetical protein
MDSHNRQLCTPLWLLLQCVNKAKFKSIKRWRLLRMLGLCHLLWNRMERLVRAAPMFSLCSLLKLF